ncbi:MAG: hypothetical protein ABGZ17_03405 [Planctomycetaceae bacterium]
MTTRIRLTGLTLVLGLTYLPSPLMRIASSQPPAGTAVVEFRGYAGCLELKNPTTRVVICPSAGGRVLEYSWKGQNSLYLDPRDRGPVGDSAQTIPMSAGRFDIGPEKVIPAHRSLWSGRWQGVITGPRAVRVTSVHDQATGVQLIREFQLDAQTSHLSCRQTIVNVSSQTTSWCHWSRTFALGNGICIIPLSKPSRFPQSYVMYHNGGLIDIDPKDPHIRQRDGFLEILGVPRFPKLGMDSTKGWFAYLMQNDLMFVKRFPTYPDRVYNEAAGLTISIWYPADRRVELEPIGPRERLAPGDRASFQEDWWLLPQKFPSENRPLDLGGLAQRVDRETGGKRAQSFE